MHAKSVLYYLLLAEYYVYSIQVKEGGATGGSRVAEIATKVKEGTATQEERDSYERVISIIHATPISP